MARFIIEQDMEPLALGYLTSLKDVAYAINAMQDTGGLTVTVLMGNGSFHVCNAEAAEEWINWFGDSAMRDVSDFPEFVQDALGADDLQDRIRFTQEEFA